MLKRNLKPDVRCKESIRQVHGIPDRKAVASGNDHQSLRYAEDIQAAKEWLACRAPIGDVLTMLEVRHRFDLSASDCRAYAVEILWAAQGSSLPKAARTTNPKESPYAAA